MWYHFNLKQDVSLFYASYIEFKQNQHEKDIHMYMKEQFSKHNNDGEL